MPGQRGGDFTAHALHPTAPFLKVSGKKGSEDDLTITIQREFIARYERGKKKNGEVPIRVIVKPGHGEKEVVLPLGSISWDVLSAEAFVNYLNSRLKSEQPRSA